MIEPSKKHFMCGEQWLKTGNPFVEGENMGEYQVEWLKAENQRLSKQVDSLMSDVHRLDTARQSAVNQARALAEEVNRLNDVLTHGQAFGERGDACVSVDGGNL